jgi:hypothetical protein
MMLVAGRMTATARADMGARCSSPTVKRGSELYVQNRFGSPKSTLNLSLEFIADVTAPSDQGFHDLNLADAFEEELWRRLKKSNLTPVGIALRVAIVPPRLSWGLALFGAEIGLFVLSLYLLLPKRTKS